MYHLLKCLGNTKRYACNYKSVELIARRQYIRNKPEKSNLIKVAVVGSGSLGDPASLIMKTCDGFVNLFNCGEGTFRLMYSKGHRFRFLSNIFCTSDRWERVGGIPSLARAFYDRTQQFPTFHGPPKIQRFLNKFAALTDLNPDECVTDRSYNSASYYEDLYTQVDFVNLYRPNETAASESSVVAYVCRLYPRKGSILLLKYTENQLPMKYIATIKDGKDVTLENGTVILAKDYLTPGFPGANFLIIDIPSKDYLPELERNELLNGHIHEINSSSGMEFVAHFASAEIVETPQYQQFMRRLNAKRHFALNDMNMYSGLKQVHSMQHTMNQLDADIYPHLCSKFQALRTTYTTLDSIADDTILKDPICIEPTTSGTRYLLPLNGRISKKDLDEPVEDEDESESSGEEIESDEDIVRQTSTSRAEAFPKVVFFGTGSSFPGVTKTVTAILVHTTPNSSILLDCGEGTVGQIQRFYGSQSEDVIKNIKALHITHMHGDHHMGVMDLIRVRQKYMPENRPRLLLMAPKPPFGSLLDFYEENFGEVSDEFIMIDNEDLISESGLAEEHRTLLNVNELRTCKVPHIDLSYAISMKMNVMPKQQEEFKLTFSGDTVPSDALVELGRDSTLLIHEATLEDTLANSAAIKKHSTISQAIEQSEKMQAKYTLLTHFSQRYRVLPPINDELIINKNIGIAFDNMEVVPDDLCKLNNLYIKLKETYADELRRVEKRSLKYALRNDFSMV